MEDKMFDLISKMYEEMQQGLKEFRSEMQQGFKEARSEMLQGFKGVNNDIIRIEDKLMNDSKTLFDSYKQTYEKLTDIEMKLEHISNKVEKQDVEIRVIRNVAN